MQTKIEKKMFSSYRIRFVKIPRKTKHRSKRTWGDSGLLLPGIIPPGFEVEELLAVGGATAVLVS